MLYCNKCYFSRFKSSLMNNKLTIYFRNNSYLTKSVYQPPSSPHRCVVGRPLIDDIVYDKQACPHIFLTEDLEIIERLKEVENVNEFFLKAIKLENPVFPARRECGIYFWGLAKAELTKEIGTHIKKSSSHEHEVIYALNLSTNSINGIKDLLELRRLIWNGNAKINESYEKSQKTTPWRNYFGLKTKSPLS